MELLLGFYVFFVLLIRNTAKKDYDFPTSRDNSPCLSKEYFDDQEQKCQQVPPCDQENHCSKDGLSCTWKGYCEPEFCKGSSNCLKTRKCILKRCMETTPHLCVYKKFCMIELPHEVDDYVSCTVDKHNDDGTIERIPIDHPNNCIHLKSTPRALNAKYIFSCQKGDHRMYSYLEIEIRDEASEPQLIMPSPPYYEGKTYNFVCNIHGLLQEPKSCAITIGKFNCTTSYSYNKRSGKAVLGCRIRLTEHYDNKKLQCYFQPRNENKKVTEGYNIVLTKATTLPHDPEDSEPKILTSQHIDNKNGSPTKLPTAVGNDDSTQKFFIDASGMDLTNKVTALLIVAAYIAFVLTVIFIQKCVRPSICKKKTGKEAMQMTEVYHQNFTQHDENAEKHRNTTECA